MSTAKRSRRRSSEARAASPLPASKRVKTATNSHVPAQQGLDFLVDENTRHGKRLEARLTNGVTDVKAVRVDESHAVVAPGDGLDGVEDSAERPVEVIDISSGVEDSEDDESGEEDAEVERVGNGKLLLVETFPNGHASVVEDDAGAGVEDQEMADASQQHVVQGTEEREEEIEEPSFGDMLQSRHPEPINVQSVTAGTERSALVPSGTRVLAAPSTTSLGTVLTQALKTNDRDLLESCFRVTDQPSIRATIERLHSQHVANLLQRLAERIHKRPGRTGNLMFWVHWSLVAHGGYLAGQPNLMRQLKSLAQVVRERANGLQPLLHLKGKLDLLSAQLDLRKRMQAAARAAEGEDEDDTAVIYVEGQDDDWSEDDEEVDAEARVGTRPAGARQRKSTAQTATPKSGTSSTSADDSDDEELPNGVAHKSDDDSSEDGDDEEADEDDDAAAAAAGAGGLLDIEAEETSDDDDEEEEQSSADSASDATASEDSEVSSDAESEPEIRPPQPRHLTRKR